MDEDREALPERRERDGGVHVIHRAAEILRALHRSPTGLSLGQIAGQVGLPRSTVHRVVRALQAEGFVAASGERGGLRLGPELGRLAATRRRDLLDVCRPFMERLMHEVDETVDLAVLRDSHVYFIGNLPPRGRRLRAGSVIGQLLPAHATANGKALLAALPRPALDAVLARRLSRPTENAIGTRAELLDELERVRLAGVAYDLEENEIGICAVGAIVRDPFGGAASVTIAAPAERFYARRQELADALCATVSQINAALGSG